MEAKNALHSGGILGSIGAGVETLKDDFMDAVWFGGAAAAGILGVDLLLSKVLVQNGVPMVPVKWSPLVGAVIGLVGGEIVRHKVSSEAGVGVIAGTVGTTIAAYLAQMISPQVAATTAAATAVEASGQGTAQMAGFGFGRTLAGLGAGGRVAGLGRVGVAPQQQLLFGVGTPDLSAAGMFGGSTVQYQPTGAMGGANVQFEDHGASSFH